MAQIQPGQVPTYEPSPSVSLTGYSDSNRTRFIFNGSQFVKAALEVSEPSFAYVSSVPMSASSCQYKNYKTTDGLYALVNGEKYIPIAYGSPTADYEGSVIIGFPVTVSTSEIILWGTAMLSYYDSLYVEYSYDDSFYFTIAGSSVSWSFESSEEQYAGESPPSGLYKYTISLGATYSARYFRITAYKQPLITSTVAPGASTINVASTAGFPDSWLSFSHYVYINGVLEGGGGASTGSNITYTGKTSTSFTGVSYETALTGNLIPGATSKAFFIPSFVDNLTEIEVLSSEPMLEFWNTDGSSASSSMLDYSKYYDIVYDKADDTYFTIRMNTSVSGTPSASFTASDDFNYSTAVLNSTRWDEDENAPNFQVNTLSGTLDYKVPDDDGRIITKYYMPGDFTSQINTFFTTIDSEGARVALRGIDHNNNNMVASMGITGEWSSSSVWEALHVVKTVDTTAGTAGVYNLRLDTTGLDSSDTLSLVYDSVNSEWTVTSTISGSLSAVSPGEDYSDNYIKSMNVVHTGVPANGVVIELGINYQTTSVGGSDPSTFKLGLSRSASSLVCKYDQGAGFVNYVTYTDSPVTPMEFELYANGDAGSIDLVLDDFAVTGDYDFDNIPVFTIESVNAAGAVTPVSGLTDASGNLIYAFDVISSPSTYNSYVGGKVQIASDNKSAGAGGAIYIKVGTDLYKYYKSLFPLATESGSSATDYKTSVISESSVNAFAYNAYSNAGLCYIEYDAERSGVYLKTIDTATISGTVYESYLDVSSSNYPWAWDQNNFTVLYYVDGTSLKEYDMDEDDVAFCSVASSERIMPAGTSSTATVQAYVLNVYGEALASKTVSFSVSSGGGAVSPSSSCTNASGIASTTYTVGSSVGNIVISAVASDASC